MERRTFRRTPPAGTELGDEKQREANDLHRVLHNPAGVTTMGFQPLASETNQNWRWI